MLQERDDSDPDLRVWSCCTGGLNIPWPSELRRTLLPRDLSHGGRDVPGDMETELLDAGPGAVRLIGTYGYVLWVHLCHHWRVNTASPILWSGQSPAVPETPLVSFPSRGDRGHSFYSSRVLLGCLLYYRFTGCLRQATLSVEPVLDLSVFH